LAENDSNPNQRRALRLCAGDLRRRRGMGRCGVVRRDVDPGLIEAAFSDALERRPITIELLAKLTACEHD
jgi:hypothetical protein